MCPRQPWRFQWKGSKIGNVGVRLHHPGSLQTEFSWGQAAKARGGGGVNVGGDSHPRTMPSHSGWGDVVGSCRTHLDLWDQKPSIGPLKERKGIFGWWAAAVDVMDCSLPPLYLPHTFLRLEPLLGFTFHSNSLLHWISLKLTHLGVLVVSRFLPHKNPTFVKDGNIDILCRYSVL